MDNRAAAAAGVALYQIDELWVVFDKHDLRGNQETLVTLPQPTLDGIIIIRI